MPPEPLARAVLVTLVLWAPTAVVAFLVWVLVPGVPARHPYTDPLLQFILSELLRSVPTVTVFAAVASLAAVALRRGHGAARRPLQVALVLGAVVPIAYGLQIAMGIPLPPGVGSPVPFRLLFSLPVVVGSLISGVPALMAVWLLEKPAARSWRGDA